MSQIYQTLLWSFLGYSVIVFVLAAIAGAVIAQITGSRVLRAATWSAIVPGAGQLYAGARQRAAQFFLIDVSLLVLVYLGARNQLAVLKASVRPRDLILLMLASIALFAYRIWATYDASVLAGMERRKRIGSGLGAAGLFAIGIILLAPHAVFAYYDVTQYNTITSIFADDDPVAAAPPVTAAIEATEPPAPPGTGDPPTPPGTGDPPTPTTSVPAATRPPIWDGLERLNLLFLGADASVTRTGIRTDTMIVLSLDPNAGGHALFSIPRNYAEAPLAEGQGRWDCQCFPDLLNALYQAGLRDADSFPGSGTGAENAIKFGIAEILGIPIHYYAMLDLEGFAKVIDALGGVEINVPETIVDTKYSGPGVEGPTTIEISAGLQTLDGPTALAYARIRRQSSDYARMNRQRCVIKALLEQSDPIELLAVYPQIAGVLRDSLRTDIPLSRLPDFIELLPRIDTASLVALSFTPANGYQDGLTADRQNKYNAELIAEHVALILSGQPELVRGDLGSGSLEAACA